MQLPERFHECLGATSACPEVTWRSEVRHCFGVIEARSVLAQVGEKHRDSASRATQFELSPASSTRVTMCEPWFDETTTGSDAVDFRARAPSTSVPASGHSLYYLTIPEFRVRFY